MISVRIRAIELKLWGAAVLFFLMVSALCYYFGPGIIHEIAVRFHQNRIDSALSEGDHALALNESKAWYWIEPENPNALANLVTMELVVGDWLAAEDSLAESRDAMISDQYEICRLMAFILAEAKDDDAVSWAKRAAATATDRSDAMLVQAHVARLMGETEQAYSLYSDILDLHPNHGEALFFLSEFAEQELDIHSVAKKRRALSTASAQYRYTPAFIRLTTRAQRFVRQLPLEMQEPDSRVIHRVEALAFAYLDTGAWDPCMKWLSTLAESEQGSWKVYYWLAINAELDGNVAAAKEYYELAVRKHPGEDLVLRHMQRLRN